MRELTAVLKFNDFVSKRKMIKWLPIIKIPVMLPVKVDMFRYRLDLSPVMTFAWKRQTGKYTHEYHLVEIQQ